MTLTHTIDDLVILGRAGPEQLDDDRATVCVGGWSHSHGFIRLYPTRMDMDELKRWNVVSIPVVQDRSHDSRSESRKIDGSRREWSELNDKIEVVDRLDRSEQRELVEEDIPYLCSKTLEDLRYSLGIVKPTKILDTDIKPPKDDQVESGEISKNNRKRLYIEYECEDCRLKTHHNQHCIEWGMYEFWRKHGGEYDDDEVVNILGLNDDDYDVYFFVGNMNHQRTAYIIISVLRFKRNRNASLVEFAQGSGKVATDGGRQ